MSIPICTIDLEDINSLSNRCILDSLPKDLLIDFLLMEIERIRNTIKYIETPDNLNNDYDRVSKETIEELLKKLKGKD